MLDMKAFGERLKANRKSLGLTQEEVGTRVGVSAQAVSKWEAGDCLPDCFNLKALSEVYGISIDRLLNDVDMDNSIETVYFDSSRWYKVHNYNAGYLKHMVETPLYDGLREVLTLGNWGGGWYESATDIQVRPNAKYRFVFWLNGGENESRGENDVCWLYIIQKQKQFDISQQEWDARKTYKLNRNFISPLKNYKGWVLYSIPFETGDNEFVQLRFVAQRAYMSVLEAKEPECYKNLSDVPDPYADKRPQRHNIMFPDGWPAGKWYSTEYVSGEKEWKTDNDKRNEAKEQLLLEITTRIGETLAQKIDMSELAEMVAPNIDRGEIAELIAENMM